jgi:hypothetical protein
VTSAATDLHHAVAGSKYTVRIHSIKCSGMPAGRNRAHARVWKAETLCASEPGIEPIVLQQCLQLLWMLTLTAPAPSQQPAR